MIAAALTYTLVSLLNLANWITLTLRALIYLTAYLITAPLIGAINKTDIRNLKEMLKELGPLTHLFNLPLYLIEKLITIFQKA